MIVGLYRAERNKASMGARRYEWIFNQYGDLMPRVGYKRKGPGYNHEIIYLIYGLGPWYRVKYRLTNIKNGRQNRYLTIWLIHSWAPVSGGFSDWYYILPEFRHLPEVGPEKIDTIYVSRSGTMTSICVDDRTLYDHPVWLTALVKKLCKIDNYGDFDRFVRVYDL